MKYCIICSQTFGELCGASCLKLLVLWFFHISLCCMRGSAKPTQSCHASALVITAKQLQRHFVLLRQGPTSNKQHGAVKVVVVISYKHFNASRSTHGSINLLEECDWTLVACNARGDFQLHVINVIT